MKSSSSNTRKRISGENDIQIKSTVKPVTLSSLMPMSAESRRNLKKTRLQLLEEWRKARGQESNATRPPPGRSLSMEDRVRKVKEIEQRNPLPPETKGRSTNEYSERRVKSSSLIPPFISAPSQLNNIMAINLSSYSSSDSSETLDNVAIKSKLEGMKTRIDNLEHDVAVLSRSKATLESKLRRKEEIWRKEKEVLEVENEALREKMRSFQLGAAPSA